MNNQSELPHAMDLSTEELIQAAVENNEARFQLVEGCYYDYEISDDKYIITGWIQCE